jgi:hypothetical protein
MGELLPGVLISLSALVTSHAVETMPAEDAGEGSSCYTTVLLAECVEGYALERHTYEPTHGDICRKSDASGHFQCATSCVQLASPPYCGQGSSLTAPCRLPDNPDASAAAAAAAAAATPALAAPAAAYSQPCTDGYTMERHDLQQNHGDVCRQTDGSDSYVCPAGCKGTGGPPFCVTDGVVSTAPHPSTCRPPRPPGALPYRCDQGSGERGVCILAEGNLHFHGKGTHPDGMCGGECGVAPPRCTTGWDCSLAGVCDRATGICTCDNWATGTDCSYLNFAPVDRERIGYLDSTHSSWGGNVRFSSLPSSQAFMGWERTVLFSP